jgi:oligopeptide transport system ATP-binding protein
VIEEPLLSVSDLVVEYPIRRGPFARGRRVLRAVDGVSFSISPGETLGLVGESGSGKTSTGRAVLMLTRPSAGKVVLGGRDIATLRGRDLRQARRQMQMVHQDPYASLDPRLTVREIVGEPLEIHHVGDRRARERKVRDLLEMVGLATADIARYPHEFSGGQRQRIGIARAIALEPAFVVCDEPISALDVSIQAQVVNLLTELQRRLGLTYLFIAHDLGVVDHVSDVVAVMYLGRIVEVGTPRQVRASTAHPYTAALMSAMLVADPAQARRSRRIILRGDIPSPAAPPGGCRFHTRCWLYQRLGEPEVCQNEDPGLRTVEPDHEAACHFTERVTSEAPSAA